MFLEHQKHLLRTRVLEVCAIPAGDTSEILTVDVATSTTSGAFCPPSKRRWYGILV